MRFQQSSSVDGRVSRFDRSSAPSVPRGGPARACPQDLRPAVSPCFSISSARWICAPRGAGRDRGPSGSRRRPRASCRWRRARGPADGTPRPMDRAAGAVPRSSARLRRSAPGRRAASPRSMAPGGLCGWRGAGIARRGARPFAPAVRTARRGGGCDGRPVSVRRRCAALRNAKASGPMRRHEGVVEEQAGFRGRRRTACPVAVSRSIQHADRAILRRAVEVDQHVAAEDDVVDAAARQKVGGEQVALLKAHLAPDRIADAVAVRRQRSKCRSRNPSSFAAKGIPPVHAASGRARARAR